MFRSLLLVSLMLVYVLPASAQTLGEVPPADAPAPVVMPAASFPGVPDRPHPDIDMAGLGNLMGGMGGMGGVGGPLGNSYRTTWLPSQPVSGQSAHLGVVQQDLSLGCPLWTTDGDMISARVHVRWEAFDTNAVLPQSQRPFPSDLYNVNFGVMGMHHLDNGWILGGNLSFGSASDQPFANTKALNVGVMGFLSIPSGERDRWMFSLMYSPLGQIPFPIPGIAYVWNPNDQFTMHIGAPFSFRYRPSEDWTIEASYMLLTTVHTQITYRVSPNLRLYGGFNWTNEGYYLRDTVPAADGSTTYQRFRYYEKNVKVGVQYAVGDAWSFDLSGGYAFDRTYNQGSGLGLTGTDQIFVGDGPFLSGQVRLRW